MGIFVVNNLVTGCNLVLTQLTDLTTPSAPQVQDSTNAAGANGTDAQAEGVALVIRSKLARRYRGGHPRVYIPGQRSSNVAANGTWTPAFASAVLTNWNTFVSQCLVNVPVAAAPATEVNVSYFQGFTNKTFPSLRIHPVPTPRAVPLIDAVISHSVNPLPASQRRRNVQSR
jgi:hypothetical protein